MLDFIRDGASGGPKAINKDEMEKSGPQICVLTETDGVSKLWRNTIQALHISAANSNGE